MANIWEKAISILAGNLNLDRSYLITTVQTIQTSIHNLIEILQFTNTLEMKN